ncbi:MAG: hypothetical protein WAL68_03355 [Candidatus Binatus sp.]|jgi:hypothetical protein
MAVAGTAQPDASGVPFAEDTALRRSRKKITSRLEFELGLGFDCNNGMLP